MGSKGEDEIPTAGTSRGSSRSAGTWVLALILAALTIPSFIFSGYPLPVITSETVSSLSIGCALPPFSKAKDTSPALSDYIKESDKLTSLGADLVLWPEGAVSFSNASDKNAAFQEIRNRIGTNRVYWAVSFEEDIFDANEHTSMRRTGVAILANKSEKADGIEMVYYKRFLVPSKL
jgi:apolipoprotein N-acyltransferase